MTFIDENTSREALVDILTGDLDAVQFCIDRGVDPEDATVSIETLRSMVRDFIEAGDECAAC